jgi:hypothetical protein
VTVSADAVITDLGADDHACLTHLSLVTADDW